MPLVVPSHFFKEKKRLVERLSGLRQVEREKSLGSTWVWSSYCAFLGKKFYFLAYVKSQLGHWRTYGKVQVAELRADSALTLVLLVWRYRLDTGLWILKGLEGTVLSPWADPRWIRSGPQTKSAPPGSSRGPAQSGVNWTQTQLERKAALLPPKDFTHRPALLMAGEPSTDRRRKWCRRWHCVYFPCVSLFVYFPISSFHFRDPRASCSGPPFPIPTTNCLKSLTSGKSLYESLKS